METVNEVMAKLKAEAEHFASGDGIVKMTFYGSSSRAGNIAMLCESGDVSALQKALGAFYGEHSDKAEEWNKKIDAALESDAAVTATECKIIMVPVTHLSPHAKASLIFPIDTETASAIQEDMELHGFDMARPLSVVKGDADGCYSVIEGNTRLSAVSKTKIKEVPCVVMFFKSQDDLMQYVVNAQIIKRHNSDAVILASAEILIPIEERKAQERKDKGTLAPNEAKGKSSQAVGLILDRGKSTVDRIKAILKDKELKEQVIAGKLSINSAYVKIHPRKSVVTSTPAQTPAPAVKSSKSEPEKSVEETKPDVATPENIVGTPVPDVLSAPAVNDVKEEKSPVMVESDSVELPKEVVKFFLENMLESVSDEFTKMMERYPKALETIMAIA